MITVLLSALVSVQPCKVVHYSYDAPSFLLHQGWSAEPSRMALATIVVPTPGGPVIVDPVVGVHTGDDVRELPSWMRGQLRGLDAGPRLPRGLRPRAILVTHLHWDHVSGATDFLAVPVYVSSQDLAWAKAMTSRESFRRGVVGVAIQREMPFFREASSDVLGDGSIRAIPLPGHTPGSLGFQAGDWLFVGDAVFERGALDAEGRKGKLARRLTDEDDADAERTRAKLRALRQANPSLRIVPAHDARALGELPDCR